MGIGRVGSGCGLEGVAIEGIRTPLLDVDWKGWIGMEIGRDVNWKDLDVVAGWGLEGTSIGKIQMSLLHGDRKGR